MEQVELTREEKEELRKGQAIHEMTQTEGFQVLKEHLEAVAFHSWVDPRETNNREEWEWREINAFHAANNAKEILEVIERYIENAEQLALKKAGKDVRPKIVGLGR